MVIFLLIFPIDVKLSNYWETEEEKASLFSAGWNMLFFPVYKTEIFTRGSCFWGRRWRESQLAFHSNLTAHLLSAGWSLELKTNCKTEHDPQVSVSPFSEAVKAEGSSLSIFPWYNPKLLSPCLPDMTTAHDEQWHIRRQPELRTWNVGQVRTHFYVLSPTESTD